MFYSRLNFAVWDGPSLWEFLSLFHKPIWNQVGEYLLTHPLSIPRDRIALTLGMVSVISWGIAEVPQIITTYREKSVKGFSVAFLMAWIIGDIFNLVGCLLEPATLKTQFYMALLYTATTAILTAQIVYYGHLCHRLEADKACKPEKVGEIFINKSNVYYRLMCCKRSTSMHIHAEHQVKCLFSLKTGTHH